MLIYRIILSLLVILCNPLISSASDTYFGANSISPALLATPFANKSPEQKKELEQIISLQKNPVPEELVKAKSERDMSSDKFVESVMPKLQRSSFPALYALLDKVGNTSHGVTDVAKEYWKTDRPYIVDKRVKALIDAHSNHSYPSGHTSGSYVWAHVMSILMPEHSKEFYTKAENIAQHRVLVGMHFPRDLEGGRQLALLTVGGLLQNQEFLKDVEIAKTELSASSIKK